MASVPVCTLTVPALFSATPLNRAAPLPDERVMVAPARLLKVVGPPTLFCQLLLPWMSKRPLLLTVLALWFNTCPPLRIRLPVGAMARVRLSRNLLLPVFMFRLAPLAMASVPLPWMRPALQVLPAPVSVSVPVPDRVPPVCVSCVRLEVALNVAVPLESARVAVPVTAPLKVRVPPFTFSVEPSVEVPETVRLLPAETVRISLACSCAAV